MVARESAVMSGNIFKIRFVSGAILVLLFYFLCLFSNQVIWIFSAGLVFAACAYEFGAIFRFSYRTKFLLAAFFPIGTLILWVARAHGYLVVKEIWIYALSVFSIFFWCVVVPLIIRYSRQWKNWGYGLVQIACSLLPCWIVLLLYEPSRGIILVTFLMVAIFDSFSYLFGKFIGSRPLASSVSPGKTIEGFLGGALAVTASFFFLTEYSFSASIPFSAMSLCSFSVLFSCVCLIGDLYESFLKRCAGVKDSGNLIPGHGGVLDRLDASFAVIPIFVPILYFVYR
jgi:phosphatidate cytidylyltransferase